MGNFWLWIFDSSSGHTRYSITAVVSAPTPVYSFLSLDVLRVYSLKYHLTLLLSCKDLGERILRLLQGPDSYRPNPHTSIKQNGRCFVGKLLKTKYLSWLSHTRKISFLSWVLLVEVLQGLLWEGPVARARELQQYWFWAWLPNTATAGWLGDPAAAACPANTLELTFFLYDHSRMSLLSFLWPVSLLLPLTPPFPPLLLLRPPPFSFVLFSCCLLVSVFSFSLSQGLRVILFHYFLLAISRFHLSALLFFSVSKFVFWFQIDFPYQQKELKRFSMIYKNQFDQNVTCAPLALALVSPTPPLFSVFPTILLLPSPYSCKICNKAKWQSPTDTASHSSHHALVSHMCHANSHTHALRVALCECVVRLKYPRLCIYLWLAVCHLLRPPSFLAIYHTKWLEICYFLCLCAHSLSLAGLAGSMEKEQTVLFPSLKQRKGWRGRKKCTQGANNPNNVNFDQPVLKFI